MVKLIIFDLDGVLVDSKIMHYECLNKALCDVDPCYMIPLDEHLLKYDGLSTKSKLQLLKSKNNISDDILEIIEKDKQEYTLQFIEKNIKKNIFLINLLNSLKNKGYVLHCCTNSIKSTTITQLRNLGVISFFTKIWTNEDVKNIKPSSEIYKKAMLYENVETYETVILEDSPKGKFSAFHSGAFVYQVKNTYDLSLSNILEFISKCKMKKMKTFCPNLNILIPMAGEGSRFRSMGYKYKLPKPLIDVDGQPMIKRVIENLNIDAKFIFLVRKEHYIEYNLEMLLKSYVNNSQVIIVDELTEGAASTTLLAKNIIDNDNPLLIANSDQLIDWNSDEFIYNMNSDGGVLCFKDTHPKWSFSVINNGQITEVHEKNPIGDNANVGIYFWKKGKDYVKYAEEMINKNIRVNNEFYVAPVFNLAINDGLLIKPFFVEKMYGLGTPEDLEKYLKLIHSKR